MSSVFRLTLRQLTGRWRLVVMLVLAVLPVVCSVAILLMRPPPLENRA